ncbi:MAG: hypothetical protein KDM81_05865, partial [Verrucomicrobiae bacterium]|nr:hypothetical protein [Verrucomicrobiae bacterium]
MDDDTKKPAAESTPTEVPPVPGVEGYPKTVVGVPPTSWRSRVSDGLDHRPIMRLLVLNPVSAGILILMLLGVFAFGFSVLKLWRTTPTGFRPVVRISLLDYGQAWSLRRSAEKHLAAGQVNEALRAYFNAAQNNLGDITVVRQTLETLVSAGETTAEAMSERASKTADWLMLLSRTNRGDVFLAARVYDAIGDSYAVLRLLDTGEREIPTSLYGVMAKAKFNSGDAGAFGEWWDKTDESAKANPVLELYHAAWLAGWGVNGGEEAALQKLEAAAVTLDRRFLANHLLLRVARQQKDLAEYGEALDRLERFQGDRMADHVDYWKMLREAGRMEEALKQAREYPYPPRHPLEVAQYGVALSELGDTKSARKVLERYGPTLGDGPAVFCMPLWALLGDLYIADQAWPELARMGRDIRALPYGNATMGGFGWFAEGRATVALGDRETAGQMFDAAVHEGFSTEEMDLEVASVMLQQGYPEQAQRLLQPLEETLGERVRYWQILFEAAYAQREDEALLFKAARRAMDLDPDNLTRRVNYAVALLTTRQRPADAVAMTLEYADANQGSPTARLNH